MTNQNENVPAGTWVIDPTHSEVAFSVKHLMISKVRGKFKTFEGQIVTGENTNHEPDIQISGVIQTASIDTNDAGRDDHLRSADFFDAENFPTMDFKSTKVHSIEGNTALLDGELTIKGETNPITLSVEFGGVVVDPYGQTKAVASATGKLLRSEYGLTWNAALETGGVLVGDEITLTLEAQAVLQK